MKQTLFSLLLLLAGIHAFGNDAPAPDPAKSAAYFTAMRMQYAKRPDFEGGGWVMDEERRALIKTYDEDNPKEFLARSGPWLQKCPVDAQVHLMRASLLLKAGDVQGHFYHRLVYYGLMTSIVTSGDGTTPKTAYQVISVDEEYTVLKHIGAQLKKQSLVEGTCDAMAVEWNGQDTTIYFDASIPMKAEGKAAEKNRKK